MPNREEVLAAYAREGDYHGAGRRLGIPPGLAYMIATGRPADNSDADPPEEGNRPGMLRSSTQSLVYVRAAPVNPTVRPAVQAWLRSKALTDRPMRRAWNARKDREPQGGANP